MRVFTPLIALLLALGSLLAVPAHAAKYDERDVAALVEIATSESEPEARRAKAVRELEFTEVRSQMSALRKLLREERSPDIRLCAACVLVSFGDRRAPRDLLLATAYEGSRTPTCSRADVALALGKLGDPAGVLHLEKALRGEPPADEPQFRDAVCRALGQLATPESRKLLAAALRDGPPELRRAAVGPLAAAAVDKKNPDRAAAAGALRTAARTDPEEKIAEQAASALLWNGVDGPGFFQLLERDPDPKVRARAARVMNRHYLSPERLRRLRAALAAEKAPAVREAMLSTLAGQKKP